MNLAIRVSKTTMPLITELNEGIAPGQECLDNPTYFLYPVNSDEKCQLVTDEVYFDNYARVNRAFTALVVEI